MSSLQHAQQWCDALGNDIEALVDLYRHEDHDLAEGFTSEHSIVNDPMNDTFTTKDELRAAYGAYSAGENGTYTFTATEWCGGRSDRGLIHWTVTIEGAKTFRGLPVPDGNDVYAAGDVAFFHSPALDKSIRVEHEDNANTMGRAAGRAMAGENEPYEHLPSFYSDLFELGYEAVGEVDNRLETIADWTEPNRKGVIYYLRDERVRGVLLWNVWQRIDEARALIEEKRTFHAADLKGRIVA